MNEGRELKRRGTGISGREILDLLIEIAYLAVIFLIPLWFAYLFPTYNIFELNKSVLFKILVWLLAFLTGLKIIFYPPRPDFLLALLKRYWLIPMVCAVGWSLTLITALNPALSFYGTPERQAGLSNYFFYGAWFALVIFNILTVSNSRTRGGAVPFAHNLRRVIVAASLSGFLVALYAVLQILNWDFLSWPEPPYLTGRALSTFGQPNFLASWLLLVIPLSCYLLAAERQTWRRLAWGGIALVQFLGLLASGSRGGLAAGLFVVLLWLVYRLSLSVWSRRQKIGAILLFLIFSIAAAWFLDYASHGRLRELKNLDYGSFGARRNFYAAAVSAVAARPWLGYGPESGTEIFIRYYAPDWGLYGDVGQSTDRAHNLILDELLSGGTFGLLLTLALYYFFFRLAVRNIIDKRGRELSLALALGAAGYLFSLLLSFPIVAGAIYFWLFLAILAVLDYSGPDAAVPAGDIHPAAAALPGRPRRPLGAWLLAVALAVLVGWRIERLARVIVADYYFNEAVKVLPAGDYSTILELASYEREQDTSSVNQASYDYLLAYQLSAAYPSIAALTPQLAVRNYLKSVAAYRPAAAYQDLFLQGKINLVLQNFSAADKYLSAVAALTPQWPPVIIEQGNLAAARGDGPAALAYYSQAARDLPDASDPRLPAGHLPAVLSYQYTINKDIAAVYAAQKDYAAAAQYYLAAYDSQPSDFTLLKKIADTYYYRGDLADAIKYIARGRSRNPGDYNWPLALAALYYQSGDRSQGALYLDEARRLAPAAAQAEIDNLEQQYRPKN
jgi:O-antigen ligase